RTAPVCCGGPGSCRHLPEFPPPGAWDDRFSAPTRAWPYRTRRRPREPTPALRPRVVQAGFHCGRCGALGAIVGCAREASNWETPGTELGNVLTPSCYA